MPIEERKEEKNEVLIRRASEFIIEYPDDQNLQKKEKDKIQEAINNGGVAFAQKTYVSEKSIPSLLSTDVKGAQIVLNNAPKVEVRQDGDEDYLSVSQLKKEITDRCEQPRSTLEREKLAYAEKCVDSFSKNATLEKERSIGADRIKKDRTTIGKNNQTEKC